MRFAFSLLYWVFLLSTQPLTAEDWPDFRGPQSNGHTGARELPQNWSDDEGIQWRVPVPGLGWSTPIVTQDTIWLTTAMDEGKSLHALAMDATSGAVRRDVAVFENNEPLSIHSKNSHASPSAVVDGDHVYLHFGTYGTACLDRAGKIIWREKLAYEPKHGPGGSPVLFEDLLIVNCDGTDVQFVVGLDKHTGKLRWKTPRAHAHPDRLSGGKSPAMAFSTPSLWHHNGTTQVISAGADHVAAYDPRTGQELWWSAYDGYSIVLRPTIADDLVFVSSCYNDPILYAIRLGGAGDVTESQRAWTLDKGVPHSSSPLVVGQELYLVSDDGIAMCLDFRTGEQHWRKRLGGNFSASLLYGHGQIYAMNETGETTVFKPQRDAFHETAKNQVRGRTLASFGVHQNALLLRTDTELLRIPAPR